MTTHRLPLFSRRFGCSIASLLAVLSLALLLPQSTAAQQFQLTTSQVPLQPGEDTERQPVEQVGKLSYRGGLRLSSSDNRFGGFSALHVSKNGRDLLALSDDGVRLDARLTYDRSGRLVGLRNATMRPLRDLNGKPLEKKVNRDAESLAIGPSGELIVGFEHEHRLWRYPRTGPPRTLKPPATLRKAPGNDGAEALTRLSDGRLLIITEGFRAPNDSVHGWLGRAGKWQKLTYRPASGFKPTAAATLPSGDVVMLERWFSRLAGISIRVKLLPKGAIQPGAMLEASELALLERPMNVDNFEGISARRNRDGETIIYIISDDNFSIFQKTLLLMFAISDS